MADAPGSIDIKGTTPIPGAVRGLGFLLILNVLIPGISKFVSLPLALFGVSLLTAYNGLLLNLNSKTYREYLWLLGLRFGTEVSFSKVEYVFLKANQVSQRMSARLATTTVYSELFDGFIRFSETNKVRIFRGRNKTEVLKKLLGLSAQLNVDVLDYTKS